MKIVPTVLTLYIGMKLNIVAIKFYQRQPSPIFKMNCKMLMTLFEDSDLAKLMLGGIK